MNKDFCAALMWLMASLMFGADKAKWNTIRPGLEMLQSSFLDQDQTVMFSAVRCDPKVFRIRVVSTFREIAKDNPYAAFSIREVRKITRALVVINAGSSASYSLPTPVGLLKVGGFILSPVNRRAQNGGIFCVAEDQLAITSVLRMESERCSDAVQRGPLLSDSLSDKGGRHQRTAVALDDRGRLLMLVTDQGTTLSALSVFLYKTGLDLRIRSALNLDGDASSGLIMKTSPGKTESLAVGNVDGLVASAIAVTNRK